MPSFDTVLEPNLVELRNAVDQATKEIGTRFDFKGSSARIELGTGSGAKASELILHADNDFQLAQVRELLLGRLAKRNVDVRFVDFSAKPQAVAGDKLKQTAPVKRGIDADTAKKIQSALKQSKLKVQASLQGDVVRVTGAKRDELQAAIALLRQQISEWPLSFENFRD